MSTKTITTYIRLLAAAVLIVSVLLGAKVSAQTETPTETTTEKQQMAERIEKRKAELKTKLTTVQKKRIQTRCKNAQGVLMSSITKASVVQKNREKLHTDMVNRFKAVETKLADKGLDTTDLKAQIVILETKIATFNTDLAAYLQATNDTAKLDCATDPTAFKASLEVSRTALQKVRADAADIRAHVVDVIKPALAKLRTQLTAETTEQ